MSKLDSIKNVAIIGSGVMGRAIAAQIANSASIKACRVDEILLLDIVDTQKQDRSSISRAAKEALINMRPAPLSHYDNGRFIKIGNLEDDIDKIADADLIIEVIVEGLTIKHELYEKIQQYIKPTAILASNTSTLPLSDLNKTLPDHLKNRFYITHFFNPPRYLELLELIPPLKADSETTKLLENFFSQGIGRKVILCNDTPGFIANRIGCFMLEYGVRLAIGKKLDIVFIDRILNKLFGFPSTGIFGLYDLIGHDVMRLISSSLTQSLEKEDRYHDVFVASAALDSLYRIGNLGRKSGKGFYAIQKNETDKEHFYLNLKDGKYHKIPKNTANQSANDPLRNIRLDNIKEFFDSNNEYSNYFIQLFEELFKYVATLIPSAAKDASDIDTAMQLGYNLKYGPFELAEKLLPYLNLKDDIRSFYSQHINASKKQIQTTSINDNQLNKIYREEIISQSAASRLIKIQKDNKTSCYIFEIHTKMGVLQEDLFKDLIEAINITELSSSDEAELYIESKAKIFSAGADLKFFKDKILSKDFDSISKLIKLGQNAMHRLKYSKATITSIASNMALGGGAEILLHSQNILAHQNLTAGLPEFSIGIIPGFGGTKEMIMRGARNKDLLLNNIENILFSRKAPSAEYFNEQYVANARICMNRFTMRQEASTMSKSKHIRYDPNIEITLPNLVLKSSIPEYEKLDKEQIDIVKFFQRVIDLKSITEEELLNIEHDKFMQLCKEPYALEKISKLV